MLKKELKKPFKYILNQIWLSTESKNLLRFKNIHQDEDCFIIGNGPSLNQMDLSLLDGYHTFGLNKIYLIFDKQPLNLSYHVAVNKLVVKQSKKIIPKLNCISFVTYVSVLRNRLLFKKNIYPLSNSIQEEDFYKDISKGTNIGSTVTYVAMQIAFYMGFKRVFLIGVDHNFVQKGNPNEQQRLNEDDMNHFDPNYFKGQKWHLADLENSEKYYLIAKQVFENHGRQIIDCTHNGKLNIFEKIPFDKGIQLAKKAE